MTKNITKAILFAAILTVLIVPTSINQADAAPDKNSIAQIEEMNKINELAKPYFAAKSELAITTDNLTTALEQDPKADVSELTAKIKNIEAEIQTYKKLIVQQEQERIQRFQIEPVLESQLRQAQANVDYKNLPISGASVSGLEKSLVLYLDESRFAKNIDRSFYENILKNQYSDIPVIIRVVEGGLESCTTPTSNCNPLVGGIRIEDTNMVESVLWRFQLIEVGLKDFLLHLIVLITVAVL